MAKSHFILTVSCKDRVGIVAGISACLADHGCFVEESSDYGDPVTENFFMRVRFRPTQAGFSRSVLEAALEEVAERLSLDVALFEKPCRKVLLMVSRLDHCLNDLLFRYRTGALPMEVVGIVSNHTDLRALAEWHNIAYHHIPVTAQTKPSAEAALSRIVEETGAETIVLARYMQVLSADFVERHEGQIINIHHSFLPSFKGARPYHRAYERGVKLIGATAHYVTADLDEGPIIEQQVERVEHHHSVHDLISLGRDVECLTLARALKNHLEHRVFLNGHRTIVFRR